MFLVLSVVVLGYGWKRLDFDIKDKLKLKPVIGMQFARKNLKFKSILVYDSPCQLNALDVEEKLQTLLRKHPLGIRLWRNIAMGSKDRFGPGYYKVFIVHSVLSLSH